MLFNKRWEDYRLAWNLSEYDGLKKLLVKPSRIWTPDILMENR